MTEQVKKLIGVLYDISARADERDDAAIYLGEKDDPEALKALIMFAQQNFKIPGDDPRDIQLLKNTCGESIANIWLRKEMFDSLVYRSLSKEAQQEIKGLFKTKRPELLKF